MTVIDEPVVRPVRPADPEPGHLAARPSRGGRSLLERVRAIREVGILTLVALIGYVASGFWVRDGLHFWINDALNRTGDAVFVTIGRDPHLGAIGFYWPPLPQLIQMPFMPFLRPFGAEIMAGPLSSAVCMALTIPVLARIGRRVGLNRWLIFAICATFALNPDIVYTASNGMSESCFFLVGAVAMLGFIGYIQERSTVQLIVFSVGLCGVVMTRLEGPLLAAALVAVATLRPRHLRSSLWQFTLIITPPFLMFVLWMAVQGVLLGDSLFFLHQNVGKGPTPGTAIWLPNVVGDKAAVIPWAFGWVVVLGPLLYVVAASVLARPLSGRTRGSLGILAGMGTFLVIQMDSVGFESGFGDPRYFVMAILFATVGAMWLAVNRRVWWAAVWNIALVASLLVSGATASYALTSGRITHVEDECTFFQYGVAKVVPFLGRTQTGPYACQTLGDGLKPWQQADAWIDHHLSSRDRVLADNASNYAAPLFTTRPKLFIVRNDRDWAKTIADPRSVTYIVTQSTTADGPPTAAATYAQDEGAVLIGLDPSGWHRVAVFSGGLNVVHQGTFVQVWRFTPSPTAGATPAGTESSIS